MVFALCLAILPMFTHAGYNANFSGKITQVLTYTASAQILIRVEGQPSTHPQCTQLDFLAIDAATPDNVRQIVLSRIMMAYASGETVNIGYDKEGGCVGGRIKVYRVG